MKIKIYVLIVSLLIVLISILSAVSQTLQYNYDFFTNSSNENTIDFSSFLLRMNTLQDSVCKYSTGSQAGNYVSMNGSFDLSGGKVHEKSFTELGDGVYNYYVKCNTTTLNGTEPSEFYLRLRVDALVTAQVVPLSPSPFNAGKLNLNLITSKFVSNAPSLKYSFDGVVYNELPLFGSEKLWSGYLIIPSSIKNGIVSFKFSGNDLQGRQGTEITSGNVFLIDTQKPTTIVDIISISSADDVKIEWYDVDDEDIVEYRIYRDTSPEVDYTDYYTTTENSAYTDKSVEKGKTYYYKISGVDAAGNEGDLSFEVSSTVLRENNTNPETGLDPKLVSQVENFLVEIDSVLSNIDTIKDSIKSKKDVEKELFTDLSLSAKLDQALFELNTLSKDADRFKLQDLTEQELNNKLNALEIKLNVAKKKIPEDITILEEDSGKNSFDKSETEKSLLEINSSLTPKEISDIVKESFNFIESSGARTESKYYIARILYLDGTTEEISIISREIFGEVSRMEKSYFVENIPKNLAESVSEISFIDGSYEVLREDPIVGFATDTKKIIYHFKGRQDLSTLKDAKTIFIKFPEPKEKIQLTGFFVSAFDESLDYGGVFLGILILASLISYLVFLKKTNLSDDGLKVFNMIKKADEHLGRNDNHKAMESYIILKEKYKALNDKDKKILYSLIQDVYSKIRNKSGFKKETR